MVCLRIEYVRKLIYMDFTVSNGSPPPALDSDRASTCGSTASGDTLGAQAGPPCSPTAGGGARLSPRMEMRLALQEGRDILAEQDQLWVSLTAIYIGSLCLISK